MGIGRNTLATAIAFTLAACGGGSSGSSGTATGGGGSGGSGPTSNCSISAQQDFAKAVLDEWYLFPDLMATGVNKASYSDVQSYIDALIAPARAQSKDRYFTYITSIAEENAYYNSGSSAGFGIRLGYDTGANRVFVLESFEGGPAYSQGFDRGTELISVGPDASSLQSISSLMASGGPNAVINALGDSTAGLRRTFVIRPLGGSNTQVTVTKADYALDPVSNRYGAKIIDDGGKKVGYINLRTFINTASSDLRTAFDNFRQQGVTEVIVDLRYNGGGLVAVSSLFADLMGRGNTGQVFARLAHRPSKASYDDTYNFTTQPEAIAATRIAFIGSGGTASASELLANGFIPYLGNDMALVGTNTYGKPVGQEAFDKAECDERIRAITFKTVNRDGQGEYFTGLAPIVPVTCQAQDDITHALGDPAESSVAQALAYLRGGPSACTAIAKAPGAVAARSITPQMQVGRNLLQPDRPSTPQREVPGLF